MIELEKWAATSLGTKVALYASHPLAQLKGLAPLILIGGVHGDEPHGVLLAQSTLKFLQEDAAGPRLVKLPWVVIPILNVDGYQRRTRVNGRGVDLNRNYPSKSWSPQFEKERYHPGTAPGSEPEVKALVDLIEATRPRLLIHCHSWEPMIVCAGDPGNKDAERLAQASGYKVVPDIGYPTPGSLSQYGWYDQKIPVICIEESDLAIAAEVWPRFQAGMREIFLDASAR